VPSVDVSSFVTREGIDFLALSSATAFSTGYIGSQQWDVVLEWAEQNYDYVLVTLSSVLNSSGLESAQKVQRVVMGVWPGETRLEEFRASFVRLRNVGVSVLAVNVMGVPEDENLGWQSGLWE
jgi:Mrp family chromosome partitioning ATPase